MGNSELVEAILAYHGKNPNSVVSHGLLKFLMLFAVLGSKSVSLKIGMKKVSWHMPIIPWEVMVRESQT